MPAAVGALPQPRGRARSLSRRRQPQSDRDDGREERQPPERRSARPSWQCPTCKTTNPQTWGWCACGFDRYKNGHKNANAGQAHSNGTKSQGANSHGNGRAPQWSASQLAVIQKAGLATYQEAILFEDLARVPRTEEKVLMEAFRTTTDDKIRARIEIIVSKEKVHDDCLSDYRALAALNFVRMLLKPMRHQIHDCRTTLSKAEDELHTILKDKKVLAAKETKQRHLISYYTQLLRELEQIRGEEADMADGESTDAPTASPTAASTATSGGSGRTTGTVGRSAEVTILGTPPRNFIPRAPAAEKTPPAHILDPSSSDARAWPYRRDPRDARLQPAAEQHHIAARDQLLRTSTCDMDDLARQHRHPPSGFGRPPAALMSPAPAAHQQAPCFGKGSQPALQPAPNPGLHLPPPHDVCAAVTAHCQQQGSHFLLQPASNFGSTCATAAAHCAQPAQASHPAHAQHAPMHHDGHGFSQLQHSQLAQHIATQQPSHAFLPQQPMQHLPPPAASAWPPQHASLPQGLPQPPTGAPPVVPPPAAEQPPPTLRPQPLPQAAVPPPTGLEKSYAQSWLEEQGRQAAQQHLRAEQARLAASSARHNQPEANRHCPPSPADPSAAIAAAARAATALPDPRAQARKQSPRAFEPYPASGQPRPAAPRARSTDRSADRSNTAQPDVHRASSADRRIYQEAVHRAAPVTHAPASTATTAPEPETQASPQVDADDELARIDGTPLNDEEYEQCMLSYFLAEERDIAEQDAHFRQKVHDNDVKHSEFERHQTLESAASNADVREERLALQRDEQAPPGSWTPTTNDIYNRRHRDHRAWPPASAGKDCLADPPMPQWTEADWNAWFTGQADDDCGAPDDEREDAPDATEPGDTNSSGAPSSGLDRTSVTACCSQHAFLTARACQPVQPPGRGCCP
jgi:hypothetical protein